MRKKNHWKKSILCLGISASLLVSVLPATNRNTVSKTTAASIAVKIKPEPNAHSVFHDTNKDGYGEFEGFGTSLCWWANRCGYSTTLTNEAAKLLYNKESGLGLSIGRYNIGGGDNPSHNHITRSDSKMPGFWSAPKKITSAAGASAYDAYDSTSGYAWNYNWNVDKNQLNVALACQKEAGTDFKAETFANSAPYFLTVSGCTSGSKSGSATNLKSNSYKAFATYLTDVTKHLIQTNKLNVTSISGMNEPESSDWCANSQKQEGCHISAGKAQSKLLTTLSSRLKAAKLDFLTLAGPDSSGVYIATDSVKALSSSALSALERIDTHAYMDSDTTVLRSLARSKKKNLWMSEVDGTQIAGTKAGEMSAALGFSSYLNKQLNGLQPSAWIIWDAIDVHIDKNSKADLNTLTDSERVQKDKEGFWGVLFANHNTGHIIKSKKYYAYGQYSRYIRPGYTIIGSSDNSVAAYDTKSHTLVVVATNESSKSKTCQIDLSQFGTIAKDSSVKTIRTSGTLKNGENWKDVSQTIGNTFHRSSKKLNTTLKGNSITTYVITNISLDNDKKNSSLEKISVHQNQITGKASSEENYTGNIADKDYMTEYRYKKGKAIIDLGAKHKIQAISYVASSLNPSSSRNITFYGSNTKKKWEKLFTITALPSSLTPSYVHSKDFASKKKSFRYIMFRNPQKTTALSEVSVYGNSKASPVVTKYPTKLKSVKSLPKKIRLKNKKTAKVVSWTFSRGKNDNMTKKQRSTILVTAHLNKSLPGYGKTVIKNVTVSPKLYKKLRGKTYKVH